MPGYLNDRKKSSCFGCEACRQVCPASAIRMEEDEEGFRYPVVDETKCVHCGRCHQVCPYEHMPAKHTETKYAFGGYVKDWSIRAESTSGGAFSAIAKAFYDSDSVIFGAEADGLSVHHAYVMDVNDIGKFRKSKYSQSEIGSAFSDAAAFLRKGKKVLFSGTPCQIAGLRAFLGKRDTSRLLLVEVVCEGVPSPHFVRKLDAHLNQKYGAGIEMIDYRYKDARPLGNPTSGKWDFQVLQVKLRNGKILKKDRWFNPFWSIWLNHLMSRPSCYACPFTTVERGADITLGDLWGVHLYCPELYGHNGGASLVVCNTEKGKQVFCQAQAFLYGHALDFATALKYQGPLHRHIPPNERRTEFMSDVRTLSYEEICKKWCGGPSWKLLWQKYVWGNRQKVFLWNLIHRGNGGN